MKAPLEPPRLFEPGELRLRPTGLARLRRLTARYLLRDLPFAFRLLFHAVQSHW